MEDIETSSMDNVVCPYCGYVEKDSFEYDDYSSGETAECAICGLEFALEVEHSTTYTTKKLECDT